MPLATEPAREIQQKEAEALEEIVGNHKKQLLTAPTTTRTIIFLDWDDTLLCSSVLSGNGIKLDTCLDGATDLMNQLDELSTSVINILNIAMSYGEVHIVTNGETGWVQLSAQKFVPRVVPYLEKLTVLSARSTFESRFPDKPMLWKFHAFQHSLVELYSDSDCIKNILSFGDSHAEREAIRSVTRGLPYTKTKSIKFAERPSIEQLQRQLELVGNCFQYIFNHEEDLDLCMSLSVASQPNTSQTNPSDEQGKE
jgi:hypothetical protein